MPGAGIDVFRAACLVGDYFVVGCDGDLIEVAVGRGWQLAVFEGELFDPIARAFRHFGLDLEGTSRTGIAAPTVGDCAVGVVDSAKQVGWGIHVIKSGEPSTKYYTSG